MVYNPYAPPTVDVAEIAPADEDAALPPFFAVSVAKLAVMTVCTLNIYQIYWFYKHWQRIAERERDHIWPLMRAFFAVIFCYPCFARIRDHGRAVEHESQLPAVPLAIGFIVCTLAWRLPDPYGWISMATFVFLLPVQRFANELNGLAVPSHDRNGRFSVWNWVAIVLGGGLILLGLAGTFLMPAEG
jgi:hypothetical protein